MESRILFLADSVAATVGLAETSIVVTCQPDPVLVHPWNANCSTGCCGVGTSQVCEERREPQAS